MDAATDTFVSRHLAEMRGQPIDLDRLVSTPSGLTPEQMMEAIGHPDIGKLGIPLMADFMAPEGSMYFDAIFGAFHGQLAIRQWLVPAMAEIDFIDFVPTAEPVWFDDGHGGSSLDEWHMVMNLDGEKIPLSRGVSVRRYRNGWITWGCDVYDTASFRQPPPPDMAEQPPPLPPPPVVEWTTADGASLDDPRRSADPFHPTDSVFFDPIAGELHGEAEIGRWLAAVAQDSADAVFEPIGPLLSDGRTAVQEWKRTMPTSERGDVLRGTSVRRVVDGLTVYAADYYDTALPA